MTPPAFTLEICAANLQSAAAAQHAGAHRIELCSALGTGGLTPSFGLLKAVLEKVRIPAHVLIRPREGHFVYTDEEVEIVCADVLQCREMGAAGVVAGALLPDGRVDERSLERIIHSAGAMECSFHRAIDACNDPLRALDALVDLGFKRVLSSGGAATAWEGRQTLRKMLRHAGSRISIMPGGGITPANIGALVLETGAWEYHMSAKKAAQPVHRGVPGLSSAFEVSDERIIRQTLIALSDQQNRLTA